MPFDGNVSVVTQYLLDAKQRLLDSGWVRHTMQTKDGYCMIGAMRAGDPKNYNISHLRVVQKAYGHLIAVTGFIGIATWNDSPGRTKAQVLEAYDRAIALSMKE